MATAELNGVEIAYEIVGEGEPLLLLNGVMMTMASWGLQTRALSRSYKCVLHDFRGQLKSGKPPGPYTLDLHADDVAALLDHLGIDRAHVVGTSYGGEVALALALRHPRRVRSLAVIASVSEVHDDLRVKVSRWISVAETDRASLYESTVGDNFSRAFIAEHPEFLEAGRERVGSFDDEWFRALADLCRAFEQLALTDRLGDIRVPTLVVAGELDVLKPVEYSRIIASRVPGARLEIVRGAGHAVVIEKPQEINELILRFLTDAG